MSPETPRSSLFKSRFSILSLLPSRHPPLHVSHPMPQKHDVYRHPTVVSSSISPVHSEYPDPSTPLPPKSKYSNMKPEKIPKRPPPLNLEITKMMYPPNHQDVIIDPDTSKTERPISAVEQPVSPPPLPKKEHDSKVKAKNNATKKAMMDDPFDVAEVEIGHRYPSWKGGKVDLKPGQVIPRNMIPSLVSRGSDSRSSSPKRKTRMDDNEESDNYESVLHNVLLTPTYFGASPLPATSPSSLGESSRSTPRYTKRRTLLDKASDTITGVARGARNSRWLPGKSILKPSYALEADRSLRAMKEREEQEMERFRRNVKPVRLNVPDYEDNDTTRRYGKSREGGDVSTWSISSSSSPVRENSGTHRRSPGWVGAREWAAGGGGYDGQRAKMPAKGDSGWRGTKAEEDQLKKKQRIWKYSIVLAILILAALIIGLCTTLLRKDSKSASSSNSSNSTDTSTTLTSSAAIPTSTSSETLTSCLDQFRTLPSPLSYPCSDCIPILSSVTNDFSQPIINGNATGVGAALQFCSLKDIYQKTSVKDNMSNWLKDASPCSGGWNGISCDSRGRITKLLLQYPNVPDKLPETVSNIWALQAIHIMGNSSVPTGIFPSKLLSSTNLKTIDIEYSALSGSIDQLPFSSAKGLNTLVLVNNQNLGNSLPDLSSNSELLTLVVTGQGLVDSKADKLPSGITYLDLSFNALSGQIPSFSQLTTLNTLYLQNNKFTIPPQSLPPSIVSLSLTSNTDLGGWLPSSVCGSSVLENCDLRLTKLSGTISTNSASAASAIAIASNSGTSSAEISSSTSILLSTAQLSSTISVGSSSAPIAAAAASSTSSATTNMSGLGSQVSIVGREPTGCGICKFT